MKKTLIRKSALALCLLSVGAFSLTGFSPTLKAEDDDIFDNKRPHKVMRAVFKNMLDFKAENPLSDEQKKQIREIVTAHKSEIQAQVKKGRDARVAFNEASTTATADAVADAVRSRILLKAKIRAKVWPILTDDQKEFVEDARADVLSKLDEVIASFN